MRPPSAPIPSSRREGAFLVLQREAALTKNQDSALLSNGAWTKLRRRLGPTFAGTWNPWLLLPAFSAIVVVDRLHIDGVWFYPLFATGTVALIAFARWRKSVLFAREANAVMVQLDAASKEQPGRRAANTDR